MHPPRWHRIALLAVLGYEGLGGLAGGGMLIARPDGRLMDMPVGIMHGAFPDFLIPGIILLGLGLLNVAAFALVWWRRPGAWLAACLAVGGFAAWFIVEIAVLRELHWLHVMWGFPVILGCVAATAALPLRPDVSRDACLLAGPLSSLLYLGMNLFFPRAFAGYDPASQTVSELSAVGVPTRPLWVALGLVYSLLVVAFGWGVRLADRDGRRLRAAGLLIALYGALGLAWPFAPMHQRAVLAAGGGTFADTMHIALGALTEALYLAALGLAAAALGRAFRAYSIATAALLFAFAVPVFRSAPRIGADLPTPRAGVWERLNIGLFLLWMIVLAAALLVRERQARASPRPA